MPGRIMDHEGAIASPQDLKKDRSYAQQASPPLQPLHTQASSSPRANGQSNGSIGSPSKGVPPPTTNGESISVAGPASSNDPPQLDQSWRESDSNKSLGLLMERTAGQCYFDMHKLLTEMDGLPTESQQQQANGVMSHSGQDTSENSLRRKRMLIEFANNQRDRFIKTLVLSDWCKDEEDKSRLIDVKVWQDQQNFAHRDCTQAVANMKNNMIPAKMPNPNIEGAMEVLATGKASWVPDLGYIPRKALTPKQILKTLQNMNVILATRLNLHEELPPHFADFSVADGRATFTVKDEFEVDLAVADEDPAAQFFFIDLRMRFSPASESIDDRLRPVMENKVNEELAAKGLKGCYEFLHNFVLTHKLNTLRDQAAEMVRGKWFDCVRLESFRRRLIVQYWAGMPGPKNWVEIGISSGKRKGYQAKPPTPHLAVRWFRRGIEVTDESLEFDWRNLNLEKSISLVIAKHTAWIMSDLQSRIQSLAPQNSSFRAKVVTDDSELQMDALSLSLPSLRRPMQVQVEPVTGQFAIMPPSPATSHTEHRLNRDASVDVAKWLASLPPAVVRERLRKGAELLGWSEAVDMAGQNNLNGVFGETVRQLAVFRPTAAWGESSALAVTFNLGGEKFWAVSLKVKTDDHGTALGKIIANASYVAPPSALCDNPSVSSAALLAMKQAAEAHLALDGADARLKETKILGNFPDMPSRNKDDQPPGSIDPCTTALFMRFSSLMRDSQDKKNKPWADEVVRLTYLGIVRTGEHRNESPGKVRHDLRLSLKPGKMETLRNYISHSTDPDIAMSSHGGLALRFLTTFGEPFVDQIQQRLRCVERLEGYLAVLKKRKYTCDHVGLSRLDLTYSKQPACNASVALSNDGSPETLKLGPPDSNPHNRIRAELERGLIELKSAGFRLTMFLLPLTLPAMQTFDRLEAKNPAKKDISIHAKTSTWYAVRYEAPHPNCYFEMRATITSDASEKDVRWLIYGVRPGSKDGVLSGELAKALKELYHEKGEYWQGLGNAISAEARGVSAALEKLDEVIRRYPAPTEASSAKPAEVKAEEAPKAPTSPTQAPKPQPPNTAAPDSAPVPSGPVPAPPPQAPMRPQSTTQPQRPTNVASQPQRPASNPNPASGNGSGNGSKKQPIALD